MQFNLLFTNHHGMSTILVTGGTGLLGTHLILYLQSQGLRPRATYRTTIPAVVKDAAEWVECDLLDVVRLNEVMHGVKQVYNCAGLVSFAPQDEQLVYKMNVEATANLVNACLEHKVEKLLHVSSVGALGRIRPGVLIDETMQWSSETSNSVYGKTKYLGELEVWRGVGEGLNAVVVNPSIIIGEHGDWSKGSMSMFKTIYHGFKWYSGGSSGFVDADDVARAMFLLMQSATKSQRFIISAENISYQQLFFSIADAMNKPRPSTMVTPFMAGLVWRIEWVKSRLLNTRPLVTSETAKTSLTQTAYNNTKLLKALPGFQYNPIDESVKRIAEALVIKYGG